MPADPIEYQIVRNLQTALQAISVAGGYHFDVVATAVKLDPNHKVDDLIAPGGPRPFVILELTPERWTYFPASQLKLALPLTIHWVSDSTPTADDSRMQTYLKGCADIEQAMAVDVTRGGLAVDTRIVRRTFDTAVDGAQVWAMIDVVINLHRTYGSPNA